MLTRLNEIFSISCMTSLETYKDICCAIISFQVFSGRNKEQFSKEEKKQAIANTVPVDFLMKEQPKVDNIDLSYQGYSIREIGFKFEPKLQNVEDAFTHKYSEIKGFIQDAVNKYIYENGIKLNIHGGFFELDLLSTNYEDWCNEYVSKESMDKKEDLIQYIYNIFADKESELNKLEDKKKQLIRYYRKCNDRIQRNLRRMRDTYGNRLYLIVKTKDDILVEIEVLSEKIQMIENLIKCKSSDSLDAIIDCKSNISGLYSELQDLQANIVEEIQIDIEMLEEDLGIELDAKEKFKEMMRRKSRI